MLNMAEPSADNEAMRPFWEKVADIIGGEDAVKMASTKHLPKMPLETNAQYDFRLSVARFTNVYRDIVESLASKPFEEETKLVESDETTIPETLADFAEDVDGDGNNLTVFAGQLFFAGINDAISWVFVDYPNETARNLAEAKAKRLRPYWSLVSAINVLEARTKKIGGETVLTYVRIFERGATETDNRVRLFTQDENGPVIWQVWAKGKDGKWFTESDGTLTVDRIPLIPFIVGLRDGKRFFFRAPLEGAVTLQMTLYRQESDLEYAKIMTAFPMLSASGVSPEKDSAGNVKPVQTGPNVVLYAPPQGNGQSGQWAYVEPSANSLKFLADDVKETKQDLRELGKQPLTAQAGLTVITTAYAAGKAKSAVNAWGLQLKDALENALVVTCQYLAIKTDSYDPEVSIYDDYDTFTEGDFASILELRKNGDLSQETTWKEAQRRSLLSAEFDGENEAKLLLKETPGDGLDEFTIPPKPPIDITPKPKDTEDEKI